METKQQGQVREDLAKWFFIEERRATWMLGTSSSRRSTRDKNTSDSKTKDSV